MTVTVALPYYRVPDLVERAVRSILSQTHRDLRLLVIGDGDSPPLHVSDSRLEVYCLPENRGTYFALQLALLASPDPWHAPHGADDWTDPMHLENLLALQREAVAMGTCWLEQAGHPPMVISIGREGWHVGIFASERLKALGGYDPSARLSQDTNVLKLLDMTGGYVRYETANPTYHITRRADSLTMQRMTGMRSHARAAARVKDRRIRAVCQRLRTVDRMKAYRESLIPAAIASELSEHVHRLSARLH